MLTTKQKQVLDFVEEYNKDNGTSPTLQEIASSINVRAVSTAHQHIKELLKKGYINQAGVYGAIELIHTPSNSMEVNIIGLIAAGSPILAIENDHETVTIQKPVINSEIYALKVLGDSMIEDGIYDGDVVIIKKQNSAENGQTVVAIIDDNLATLKKIYKEKNRIRLQPANQTMLPIYRNEVEIRGVVWEIRRSYKNYPGSDTIKKLKFYKTLDLFAGIGGIRKGFEKAGFKSVFSNDFDKACKITYDLNFKDAKLVVEDITKINTRDLPDFDFLLAGFPCQAFSVAGYRQGFKDEKGRGNLFFDIARIIEDKQPEGFLLENVKNLRSHDNGRTFKIIEETLLNLGYYIKSKVLNSMEYGNVPQNRERVYIVGFKDITKYEAFEFPDPIKLTRSVTDILETKVNDKYYYNNKPLFEKLKHEVTEKNEVYQWRRQYVRKNKKGVCPTLTANMGMGGHNVPIIYDGIGIRKLTPRECARLQGYPDSYKFPEIADSLLYKQIGNSVTVPVIEAIANNISNIV